ncbi:hypothetical protein [Muriicola marianensis]|nr:hypothetical protein [Muriicola marianensis]
MNLQSVLVYLTLLVALVYLVNKFLLPKKYRIGRKGTSSGCGQDDCGCS